MKKGMENGSLYPISTGAIKLTFQCDICPQILKLKI